MTIPLNLRLKLASLRVSKKIVLGKISFSIAADHVVRYGLEMLMACWMLCNGLIVEECYD